MSFLEDIAKNLDLQEVTKDYQAGYSVDYEAWMPCAEIEAVNYTPWWGGDYRTRVRDPETLRITSFPTSETVKGVLRWILRAALNAHLDTDIKTLDEIIAKIYGGTRKIGKHEEHLDSLIRIRVKLVSDTEDTIARCLGRGKRLQQEISNRIRSRKDLKPEKVEEALSSFVKTICSNSLKSESECKQEDCKKLNDYLKLFKVPRFRLTLMPAQEERNNIYKYQRRIVGLLPVPPGELRIKIYIDVRRGFEKAVKNANITHVNICRLTLASLVYALVIHGLGRASTRGFGRFNIDDIKVKLEELKKTQEKIAKWINMLKSSRENAKEVIRSIHDELVSLARILATRITGSSQTSSGSQGLLSPSFNNIKIIIKQNNNVSSVYDALYVIGCATLKQEWKRVLGINRFDSGVNLHTWILGLPRWQQATGYIILKDLMDSDDVCLPTDEVVRGSEDVRRKSVFTLFPLPNNSTIVAVGYKTYADHDNMLKRLYHVGAHTDKVPDKCLTESGRNKKSIGKRLSPGDVRCRHAVRISYVLENESVGPGKALDECEGCCGKDNGGVHLPVEKSATGSLERVYNQAEEALSRLLEECRPPHQMILGPSRRTVHGRRPYRGRGVGR